MRISKPYLISSSDLTLNDIELIFNKAQYFDDAPEGEVFDDLKNFSVCTMFFEPSTRTKISFELAARRLSAITVDFDLKTTSYVKGEGLLDTIHNLEAMGIKYFISRNSDIGTAQYFANNSNARIINAGEGTLDHPTQGLLDAYTLYKEYGSFSDLKGKKICFVGDVRHSRVARANFHIMKKLGINISSCSPSEFTHNDFGITNYDNIIEAIENNDIIMMLRIQRERIVTDQKFNFNIPSNLDWYKEKYSLSTEIASRYKDKLFMHPGPANFGVEIEKEVETLKNSLIHKQVKNGVMVRMAILSLLSSEF
jgi:aspartate carbamoyltransferase catalytic subunit